MSVKQTQKVALGRYSGFQVHPVSLGAMRLPDEEQAIPLLRQAIDAGMIYIDTCRGYGDSEIKVGKSLKDGYREKVILSTKYSPWMGTRESADAASAERTYRGIVESMERLHVDYLDFYQVWNVHRAEHFQEATQKGAVVEGILRAIDEGIVGHTGFTTHDTPENISRYIDEADWCEAILFTYNFFNPTYKDVIAKAHAKGIATVVMNPVGGGTLTEDSAVIRQAVQQATGIDNVVEAAHRYLNGNENVDTILCGIAKPSDVVSTIENYEKPPLTKEQTESLEAAVGNLSMENMGFCTGCKYCMPCPQNIDIPAMMNVAYHDRLVQLTRQAQQIYGWSVSEGNPDRSADPAECTECGQCEEKCTQQLEIIEELKYITEKFAKKD